MGSGRRSDPCSGKWIFGFGRRSIELRSAVARQDLVRKAGQVAMEQITKISWAAAGLATNECSLFVSCDN